MKIICLLYFLEDFYDSLKVIHRGRNLMNCIKCDYADLRKELMTIRIITFFDGILKNVLKKRQIQLREKD